MLRIRTALVLLVVLAACADAGTPDGVARQAPPGSAATTATRTVPLCSEVPVIAAPAGAYGDHPVYVANEMPVEEVQEWASTRPGYETIWIDRDHNGWITVAFSQNHEARQSELATEFPGVGAVAVGVDWHLNDLSALQQQVTVELQTILDSFATGVSVTQGVVGIDVGVLTDEVRAEVASRFGDEAVCVEGRDPSTVPAPGPQPQAGDGWRLLADAANVGMAYRTGIATDPAGYSDLWTAVGIETEMPEVDFEQEVVIWFGAVFSSGCEEIRLDDVIVDGDMVHGEIVLPNPPAGCAADANPHAYVVAVDRAKLPVGPFAIQLGADGPPPGAPEERTIVDADLSVPGAIAGPGAIGVDPNAAPPVGLTSGDVIEPGVAYLYSLYVHCGIEWLGEFNGVIWKTAEATPQEWRELIGDSFSLDVDIVLRPGPEPAIEATAGGTTVVYEPSAGPIPGCD